MTEERNIFETRLKDYKHRAQLALEVVNRTTDKFNSYGSSFGIWRKSDIRIKCKEDYIKGVLSSKLKRNLKNGVDGENLKRYKLRYRLIEKELQEPAKAAIEAVKAFGRLMVYDAENYNFTLDSIKLEKSALIYAEDLE